MHALRRVDLVAAQQTAGQQLEDIESSTDLGRHHRAIVPVHRPRTGIPLAGPVDRSAIEEGNLLRVSRIRPVEDRDAALIPRLHHHIAPRNREHRAVVRHAVLEDRLGRRHLVVALHLHPAVAQGEECIGAPLHLVRGAALRLPAAAPLVGEEDLAAIVIEGGRVPVREVGVGRRIDPHRVGRIADVEQQAVATTGATRQADGRVHRDVVALARARGSRARAAAARARCTGHHRDHIGERPAQRRAVGAGGRARTAASLHDAVQHRPGELRRQYLFCSAESGGEGTRLLRGCYRLRVRRGIGRSFTVADRRRQAVEDSWRGNDGRLLRMRQRHLDHFDPEERRVGVFTRGQSRTSRQLARRAHAGRTGDVDVDIFLVLRIHQHGVRMGAAAGLHVPDVFRMRNIRDIEDANAAQAHLAHRIGHTLGAAIDAAREPFTRDEEEIAIDRDIALRRGTVVGSAEGRLGQVADVPDLVPAVAALDREVVLEGKIGIRSAHELRAGRRVGDQPHIPGCLGGRSTDHHQGAVLGRAHHRAGAQAHPRIGRRGGHRHIALRRCRHTARLRGRRCTRRQGKHSGYERGAVLEGHRYFR